MKKNLWSSYFSIVKFIGLVIYTGRSVVLLEDFILQKCLCFLIMSGFLFSAVALELLEEKRFQKMMLFAEGIMAVLITILFPENAVVPAGIFILDIVSVLGCQNYFYLLSYLALLIYPYSKESFLQNFLYITVLTLFYIQEKQVVEHYRSIINTNEQVEGELKQHIVLEDKKHQEALHKSRLHFENQMLEEKGRISQALHDKLGHSINGSLYKLEAAKLLIEKKPEDCKSTIQDVIDNLRESMDEIRMILRREKPDKNRMAMLSLQSLCEECEENYQIRTHLSIHEDSGKIPDKIWEIILDNTYEAVTNALKYADCKNIYIEINTMNQLVRCMIRDDGKGADAFEEGMGVAGMKKRARSVKGFLDIETEVGVGFTINMILPLV